MRNAWCGWPGEPPDRVLERERLAFPHPVAEQVGRVARVAELAGVGAGVGQAEQDALVGEQLADLVVAVVVHDDPEAGRQVVGEREVEHEVERRRAPLLRQPVERGADEVVVGVRLLDVDLRPPVGPRRERRRARPVAPRRIPVEGGPLLAREGEHLLPLVDLAQRRGIGQVHLHDDRAAGDLRVHLAGQRRAPHDRAQRRAGLVGPGHERGPRDGHAVLHRQLRELVHEEAGPDRHLEHALAQLAQHRGQGVHLARRSAKRLGTGRPNAPWWLGWRDVENPMAPSLHGLAQEVAHRVDLVGRWRVAPRRRARRGAAWSGRRRRRR